MTVEQLKPEGEALRVTTTPEEAKKFAEEGKKESEGAKTADITQSDKSDNKPQRPEWVPEEYWDAEKGEANYEALAKGYAELKAKDKPAEEGKSEENTEQTEADKKAAAEADALQQRANAEFEKDGKLSDATYKEYEKRGVSRDMIDTYIAGVTALVDKQQQKAYSEVGGEDDYKSMIEWARGALTTDEIAAYDRAVYSGNDAEMLNAVRGLNARYTSANGRDGKLLNTTKSSGQSADLFESKQQLVEAMRNPKYERDSAYRDEVQAKLDRSLRAGKRLGI